MMNINRDDFAVGPPSLKLEDKVRIIGPFIAKVNCSGRKFEGQTGIIAALGHNLKSCLVKFDDSSMCGVGCMPGNSSPCDHLPMKHMDRRMVVVEKLLNLHPQRKAYKLLSTINVILMTKTGATEPTNNDGRSSCFWCGRDTRNVPGFTTGSYDFCEVCEK